MLMCRVFPTPTCTTYKDQSITSVTSCPTLCNKCVGSLTSPAYHNNENAGDGAYGLLSLSMKIRTSNHLQMSLQRQHILLSYFKTLSVGPVWGPNLRTEPTGRHIIVCIRPYKKEANFSFLFNIKLPIIEKSMMLKTQ